MKQIAIAIIHGIGRQDKSYADTFISKIKQEYTKLNGSSNLVFKSICWQEEIEPIEQHLYSKIKLNWKMLRSFFIGYGGDALCYQPLSNSGAGFYEIVHKSIDKGLAELSQQVNSDAPLCIISHSLGTVVSSNFIWDTLHGSRYFEPSEASKSMINKLKILYTMASPLSVWSMRYPNGGEPINLAPDSKWYNLYSTNDIISSELKLINQQYNCMPNLEDIHIKVGGLITSWNPLSHNSYWDDKRVISHISNSLLTLSKKEG